MTKSKKLQDSIEFLHYLGCITLQGTGEGGRLKSAKLLKYLTTLRTAKDSHCCCTNLWHVCWQNSLGGHSKMMLNRGPFIYYIRGAIGGKTGKTIVNWHKKSQDSKLIFQICQFLISNLALLSFTKNFQFHFKVYVNLSAKKILHNSS